MHATHRERTNAAAVVPAVGAVCAVVQDTVPVRSDPSGLDTLDRPVVQTDTGDGDNEARQRQNQRRMTRCNIQSTPTPHGQGGGGTNRARRVTRADKKSVGDVGGWPTGHGGVTRAVRTLPATAGLARGRTATKTWSWWAPRGDTGREATPRTQVLLVVVVVVHGSTGCFDHLCGSAGRHPAQDSGSCLGRIPARRSCQPVATGSGSSHAVVIRPAMAQSASCRAATGTGVDHSREHGRALGRSSDCQWPR